MTTPVEYQHLVASRPVDYHAWYDTQGVMPCCGKKMQDYPAGWGVVVDDDMVTCGRSVVSKATAAQLAELTAKYAHNTGAVFAPDPPAPAVDGPPLGLTPSELLGKHVRVWDGPHTSVRAEGEVIAVITSPTIMIRDKDGGTHYESTGLPIDVETREWRRR